MGDEQDKAWAALAQQLVSTELAPLDIDCFAAGLSNKSQDAVRIEEILFLSGEIHEEPKTLQSHCASLIAIWSAMQTPTLIDLGHCGCVGRKMLLMEPRHGRRFAIHASPIDHDRLLFVVFSATKPWADAEFVKRLAKEFVATAQSIWDDLPAAKPPAASVDAATQDLDWYQFTSRELEILKLVADGLSNKQIAKQLGSSPNTVRNQIHAVFRKTGVSNRTELAMKTLTTSTEAPSRSSDRVPAVKAG